MPPVPPRTSLSTLPGRADFPPVPTVALGEAAASSCSTSPAVPTLSLLLVTLNSCKHLLAECIGAAAERWHLPGTAGANCLLHPDSSSRGALALLGAQGEGQRGGDGFYGAPQPCTPSSFSGQAGALRGSSFINVLFGLVTHIQPWSSAWSTGKVGQGRH